MSTTNQTYTERRYVETTECAKLIRQALKEAFPGVKFSVKSHTYSMGSHVSVSWTDGPTSDAVTHICHPFEGSDFDGMQDLKTYYDTEWNGEKVHFANDGTSCSRNYSLSFLTRVAEAFCAKYPGHRMPIIKTYSGNDHAYIDREPSSYNFHSTSETIQRLTWTIDGRELDTLTFDLPGGAGTIVKVSMYTIIADGLDELGRALQDAYEQAHRQEYLTTELLPILKAQRDGFQRLGDEEAVALLDASIASKEQELVSLASELDGIALVTVLEDNGYQKRVRVLSADGTSFKATIGGEMVFYLKRYNAKLVDATTFEAVLNARVA